MFHTTHKSLISNPACTRRLRQRTTAGVSAVAFAAVERQSNGRGSGSGSGSGANSTNPDDQGGNNDHDNHVVLHCVDRSGTMSEASTFGVVWNVERDSSGPADVSAEAAAEWRVWHVCADMEASLLVRETVRGGGSFCFAILRCQRGMATILSLGFVYIGSFDHGLEP